MCERNSLQKREEQLDNLAACSLQLMWKLRQDAAQIVETFALTPVKALVLKLVGCGYTQPKDLASRLRVAPPAVTVSINELVDQGLMTRQSHTDDRRRVQLALTPRGRETCRDITEAWKTAHQGDYAIYSTDELELLGRLVQKLALP